jgi:hypothetical protein
MNTEYRLFLNEDIPSIMSDAANSKADFMKFIEWYGYKQNSAEYRLINFAVKGDSGVKLWFSFFAGDPDYIMGTTEKYKQHMLKLYKMDLHEFLARCAVNLKDAMETLFYEECPKWLLKKFNERLHSNNPLTLEFVFNINQSDKWYNSLSKIVRSNF